MTAAHKTERTTIVWFRNDLRTDDHRPLVHAQKRGRVVPVFIHTTVRLDHSSSEAAKLIGRGEQLGGAAKWWLHHSLKSLDDSLTKLGSPLVIRTGDPASVLNELCKEVNADQVMIHESREPHTCELDDQVDATLSELTGDESVELIRFQAELLWPIGSVLNGSGAPYKVYTPFWKEGQNHEVTNPIKAPAGLTPPKNGPKNSPKSESIDSLSLLPTIGWDKQFASRWTPGEPHAQKAFRAFFDDKVDDYNDNRNQLDELGGSALSASIRFGELSVRRLFQMLTQNPKWEKNKGVLNFTKQLGWRDFGSHLLNHFPETVDSPFREQFASFPWSDNEEYLDRWKRGQTGYPVVDAAMRHLWAEGWMPNRARMIVASFLCKHLLISWTHGADWFMDTLIDADLGNNVMGWQWTAGCGADAAPYFRIFNPITQGTKFDPSGDYVRQWVPELAELPTNIIHSPWDAAPMELLSAGVTLGETYPHPIVEHRKARDAALEAFERIKQ